MSDEEDSPYSSDWSLPFDDEDFTIKPYQFEPEFSSGEELEEGEDEDDRAEDENSRTRNLDW